MSKSLRFLQDGLLIVGFFVVVATVVLSPTLVRAEDPVDFGRDIASLLRRSCWECHGATKQEGGLRLDQADAMARGGDSGEVVRAGEPNQSELLRRVSLPEGDAEIMPSRGQPLSSAEIARLKKWIEQGAIWPVDWREQRHWSYVPPQRPALPAVRDPSWPRSPIDSFVLAHLERNGLKPSPEATRATWLRRVSFDLTGLPPTPEECREFLADNSPLAYQRVVDRLLESPQFGARWARPWLDYARYADSHGFQRDDFRDIWAYRDWVVDALNGDMPFDQFTIEQLAGDLLPNATESQRIATGLQRNAPTNVEAGSDPEETRTNQVFDRVNTLGMVWLGTTLECAQCHDHKYDPFTMRDYYGLFACFNQTEIEADRANPKVPGSIRFLGPEMELADESLTARRTGLKQSRDALTRLREERLATYRRHDPPWEASIAQQKPAEEADGQVLAVKDFSSLGGATHTVLDDQSILLSGEAPDRDTYTIEFETQLVGIRGLKLETLSDPSLPGNGPGRGDALRPNFVLHDFRCEIGPLNGQGASQPLPFVSATADYSQPKYAVDGAIDDDPLSAWAIGQKFGQPHWATFVAATPFGFSGGTRLTVKLTQNFGGARTIGRLRVTAIRRDNPATVDSKRTAEENALRGVLRAVAVPAEKRTAAQWDLIAQYRWGLDSESEKVAEQLRKLDAELGQQKPATTLVMRELAEPRATHLFRRGDFRSPGEVVGPAAPSWLVDRSGPVVQNRLDLARWLVSPGNPLVGRVVVNRWWAEFFGRGLVETPEDFGVKGEPPSHPDLLDWLAVEYQSRDWSLKALLREIALSATYRQSARATPELLQRDPLNRLLGRGPRGRLEAEAIRDNALAVSGLLSFNLGGPPVRPFQPEGLWVKVGGQRYDYEISPGGDAYRRGLYVVWKRAAPYPSFMNFDASSRLACRVRRARTNTPLQALTLLNDPVYIEAAVALARRVLAERRGESTDDQLRHLVQLALGREPSTAEFQVLRQLKESQQTRYEQDPSAANAFLASGRWQPPEPLGPAEFLAWYAVSSTVLNLDEFITKP